VTYPCSEKMALLGLRCRNNPYHATLSGEDSA
jgi:hypothetical protein